MAKTDIQTIDGKLFRTCKHDTCNELVRVPKKMKTRLPRYRYCKKHLEEYRQRQNLRAIVRRKRAVELLEATRPPDYNIGPNGKRFYNFKESVIDPAEFCNTDFPGLFEGVSDKVRAAMESGDIEEFLRLTNG